MKDLDAKSNMDKYLYITFCLDTYIGFEFGSFEEFWYFILIFWASY